MSRIAVIPAKKRSKRCPNKNWKPFHNGKSLTRILVEKCQESKLFDRIVVSIDFKPDPELELYQKVFGYRGVINYFRVRPWWYRHWMSSAMVCQDALEHSEDDIFFFMQPTSPFLSIKRMKEVAVMMDGDTDAVVTVNPAYKPNGAIYAGSVEVFMLNRPTFWPHRTVSFPMNWLESIDIDYEHDFVTAQRLYDLYGWNTEEYK